MGVWGLGRRGGTWCLLIQKESNIRTAWTLTPCKQMGHIDAPPDASSCEIWQHISVPSTVPGKKTMLMLLVSWPILKAASLLQWNFQLMLEYLSTFVLTRKMWFVLDILVEIFRSNSKLCWSPLYFLYALYAYQSHQQFLWLTSYNVSEKFTHFNIN